MKNKISLLILIFALFTIPFYLNSDEIQELTINATVESRCKIEVSTHLITFTRVNPDVERLIPQNEEPIEITVKVITRPHEKIYLRVQATEDLIDPKTGQKIDISNIKWKAKGKGFKRNGHLTKLMPIVIGSWNKSGIWNGTLIFYLENKLTYAPGTYSTVVTFTVSDF